MAPVRLEESFEVRAPADLVWSYFTDPAQVMHCLPGGELATAPQAGNADRCAGTVRVKVGPVTVVYDGVLTLDEHDAGTRRARLRAEGQERGGTGTASVATTVALAAAGQGLTTVRLATEAEVSGRIAEFGPVTMETVSRQVLRGFGECVRATLEPRASTATSPARTEESLTLSGAFREHPMLRDTDVGLKVPAGTPPARTATSMPEKRETAQIALLPRLWQALTDRLRPRDGGPRR
jgi:carbon monoxide dehydrogenase subunit G